MYLENHLHLNLTFLINPKLVLLDFEKAAISAVKEVFPDCQVIGCYFHFIQALWKNIQNKGLTTEYRSDPYFKKWVYITLFVINFFIF